MLDGRERDGRGGEAKMKMEEDTNPKSDTRGALPTPRKNIGGTEVLKEPVI